MKKAIIVIIITIFIISCSSKKISPKYETAVRYFYKYMSLYFEGKIKFSENIFDKALKEFISMDDMCSASKLYISKYIIYLPEKKPKSLKLAGEYANLGNCENEKNIFNFLSGQKFDINKLEEPYKTYAMYDKNRNINILLNTAKSSNISNYAKSRLYRFAANEMLKAGKNINKAEEITNNALKIDKFNGWSLLIVKDLKIKLEICKILKTDCSNLEKRIDLINKGVIKN